MSPNLQEQILQHWEQLAAGKSPGELVTHPDRYQVMLELHCILDMLEPDDSLLDVGCGNGFSSSFYAQKCRRVLGIDYSAEMIKSAREAHSTDNLSFEQADVLNLNRESLGVFDTIVTTRCLINLTNWDDQKKAILNLHGLLKKGGRLIFAEGIKQGRDKLNSFRVATGIESMPPVWHNIDMDLDALLPFLEQYFTVRRDVRFGLYDVLTRVFYPASITPESPKYNTAYQEAAHKMQLTLAEDPLAEYSREAILELVKKR